MAFYSFYNNESLDVTFELEYQPAGNKIVSARCTNNSTISFVAQVFDPATGIVYPGGQLVCPPGVTQIDLTPLKLSMNVLNNDPTNTPGVRFGPL
jgi:hypothetical protein